MGPLSKSYVQSVSWIGDVARNRELTNHESSSKLSYLFWDGVAQPIQSASLAPDPPSSQFAESSQIGHWRLTSMLDPQNSVAVPFGEVQSYIHNLFNALGFSGTIPAYPTEFAVHLKKKPHEYLALRFMPQAECNTIAPFSISPPTDHIIRIFVLYKGLSAQTANIWGGCEPSYSQGAGIWKDIAGLTGAGWGCLNVVEISWMEVL
ncbi:hypothetical protein FRC08_006634 [Ceratobasidium sp. 394]|nr:hypothetical protein FRC08_006634 [Ceratobasidium sp. 394]